MKFETILVDTKESIATITLNRPEKMNALIPQMAEELISAFGMVDKDIEIKAVVITATGRAFSAGADIGTWFLPLSKERRSGSVDDVTNHFLELTPLALSRIRKPVIAAINGLAVGFGCSLTLPCDIRIASEDAKFSLPFARAGVSPEMGSSYFLSRLIGLGKACELILSAKTIDAKEAKEIGLVNQVVPAVELMKTTYDLAKNITKLAPLALKVSKRAIYHGLNSDLASQLQYESLAINYLFGTEDFEEACHAFLMKRPPIFKGK